MICDTYKISKEDVDIFKECYGLDKTDELYTAIIDFARERTRLYCIPARWECRILDDGTAVVKRYRNAPAKVKVEVRTFNHV
jgi:hypothetical protein